MFTKTHETNDSVSSTSEADTSFTLIGVGTTLTGNIESIENLQIEGQVTGDIKCDELIVTETGRIIGDIVAKSITAEGTIKGQVRTDNLRLRKTSRIEGGVILKNWIVDSGAKVDATCSFVNEDLGDVLKEEAKQEVETKAEPTVDEAGLEAKAVETAAPKISQAKAS